MTDLDKDTVKYLTSLSRIDCSEEEQEAILIDLQNILDYISLMEEIDTDNIPPCNHVLEGMMNVMREDNPGETLPREVFLSNAPSQIGGMIRVPPVIKQS